MATNSNTGGNPTVEHSQAFKDEERKDSRNKGSGAGTDIQAVVTRLIRSADNYYTEELEPHQTEATDYFYGRPFVDDQTESRSAVVATELRDAIEAVKPSLLRIFLGPTPPVEYMPRRHDTVPLAKQQTEAVRYILTEENDGFRVLSGAFDDSMMRKIGIVKFFADDPVEVTGESFTNISLDAIAVLLADESSEVQLLDVEPGDVVPGTPATPANPATPEKQLYNVWVRRKKEGTRIRIEGVPNEEFRYAPARTIRESNCVAHSREVPRSDLVARGYDVDWLKEQSSKGHANIGSDLYESRQFSGTDMRPTAEEVDESMTPILFTEAYCRVDVDGDDIAEWRCFECVGDKYTINPDEEEGSLCDGPPFAVFSMRPLAHMIAGLDFHDFIRDLQRIMSQIERAVLDSLALSIEQKVFYQDGKVNAKDLKDPDLLNYIRTTGDPNQVVRIAGHAFIGPQALEVAQWFEHKKEERIGVTKASRGLDADSLQSATKEAVAGTLEKAQERIEMIARALAETGMKDLYKGLLRLVTQHQNRPMMVRIRGRWVEVDPRGWDADMDVVVNVGTGATSVEDRKATLMLIAEDQVQHMANQSPLVSWVEVRNVRERLMQLLGYNDADEFYKPWGPQEQQALEQQQQQAQQNAPPDPATMLAQVEQAKAQLNAMIEQGKLSLDQQKLELDALKTQLEDDRERDKAAMQAALKEYEIETKLDINDAELSARIAERRAEISAPTEGGE